MQITRNDFIMISLEWELENNKVLTAGEFGYRRILSTSCTNSVTKVLSKQKVLKKHLTNYFSSWWYSINNNLLQRSAMLFSILRREQSNRHGALMEILYITLYVYVYTWVCVCVCIYTCTYTHKESKYNVKWIQITTLNFKFIKIALLHYLDPYL